MYTIPKLRDSSLFIERAYVNGEFTAADSGAAFNIHDPATGKLIGTCPDMNDSDVHQAVAAAAEAFSTFRNTLPRERSDLLRKWYNLIIANAEDLAILITWENGKPLADSRTEVTYAANFLSWFSEEAPRVYGDTIPSSVEGNRILTLRQPVGVCGLITPWNFPAAMITRKIGPALAAGCTIVAKSPGETPFTCNALAMLAHRAGIPKGVINIVTALENTAEVGKVLTTDPRIQKVSFTGSTNVGKLLMQQAAGTMKKVSFELGGNAAFIVFDDCPDIDAAVEGAIASKFRSSGQTCVCANRIFVQREIHDRFAAKFCEKVRAFEVGPGFGTNITHGPLIHERAVQKVENHVHDARVKGAEVLVGGERLVSKGLTFYSPTVLTGVTQAMHIAHEETFGPVAGLMTFDTEKEVVTLANNTPVGLAGYFYSRDIGRIYRVAEALDVGMVGVNTGVISDAAAPFGGVKQSGLGREGSKYGIDDFTIIKSITIGGITTSIHHYITPRFYTETKPESGKVVPTWNYAATQAYGRAKIRFDSKSSESGAFLSQQIYDLSQHAEASVMGYDGKEGRQGAWKVADAPEKYIELLQRAIIGIEIKLDKLEGRFKMSQESTYSDREGLVKGFEALGSEIGDKMASVVKKRGQLKDARRQ